MSETLDMVPSAEVGNPGVPLEAELSVAGTAIILKSRIRTTEELLEKEIIFIDHARYEQLVIPHYASSRARPESITH